MGASARARWLAGVAAGAAAVQYLPSIAVLGQWGTVEAVPGDLCRWRGPCTARGVALTFDDGPHPAGTPAVLDRLGELGLRGTFFALGAAVAQYPDLVSEIVRRGHQVETHGYRHGHHLARSPWWVHRDLARADATMAAAGVRPTWYRPTYGQATAATFAAARRRGWRTVLWSAWGREWATADPVAVAGRVRRRLAPGAVVLLHDSDAAGRPGMWRTTRDALELVAADLADRRLAALTLDELVTGPPGPDDLSGPIAGSNAGCSGPAGWAQMEGSSSSPIGGRPAWTPRQSAARARASTTWSGAPVGAAQEHAGEPPAPPTLPQRRTSRSADR